MYLCTHMFTPVCMNANPFCNPGRVSYEPHQQRQMHTHALRTCTTDLDISQRHSPLDNAQTTSLEVHELFASKKEQALFPADKHASTTLHHCALEQLLHTGGWHTNGEIDMSIEYILIICSNETFSFPQT